MIIPPVPPLLTQRIGLHLFRLDHAAGNREDQHVALDPGWAAIGGAAIGTFATLGVTWIERWGERHDRTEAHDREDHLRRIDQRQELYAECLVTIGACEFAIGRAFGIWHDTQPPEPIPLSAERAKRELLDVDEAESELYRVSQRIDLVAPNSVVARLDDVIHLEFNGTIDSHARLRYASEPATSGPPGKQTWNVTEFRDARVKLLEAMRADLRIREPVQRGRSRPTRGRSERSNL